MIEPLQGSPRRRPGKRGLTGHSHPRGTPARPLGLPAGQADARRALDAHRRPGRQAAGFSIRGEYGHDIIDDLAPLPGELVIDKPGKGSFYATGLHDHLKAHGITSLVVTGVTTEVCVHTTVREANDRGYECLVLSDCVGSYFPEFQRVALAMISAQGDIFGWVASSSTYLAAMTPASAPLVASES